MIHELSVKYESEKLVTEKQNQCLKDEITNEKMVSQQRIATQQYLEGVVSHTVL